MKTLSNPLVSVLALTFLVSLRLPAVDFDPTDLRSASVSSNNSIIADISDPAAPENYVESAPLGLVQGVAANDVYAFVAADRHSAKIQRAVP